MNNSGIAALDLRVLVKPDDVERKTAGGIIIPESASEQKKFAMQKGTLIAVGENAWEEADTRSPQFVKPKAGDRVLIMAGVPFKTSGSTNVIHVVKIVGNELETYSADA